MGKSLHLFKEYMVVFGGQLCLKAIAQLVKGLEILRAFDLVLRQPAYHLPTGHFALGAFLNDLAVFQFSKDAGDKLHRFRNCLVSIQLPRNAI